MQGEIEPMLGEIEINIGKLGNSENSNFLLGWRGVLDLHKSGYELSLDLYKSSNELSLDLHKSWLLQNS